MFYITHLLPTEYLHTRKWNDFGKKCGSYRGGHEYVYKQTDGRMSGQTGGQGETNIPPHPQKYVVVKSRVGRDKT